MWLLAAIGGLLAVSLGFAVWGLSTLFTRDSGEPDPWMVFIFLVDLLLWIILLILWQCLK